MEVMVYIIVFIVVILTFGIGFIVSGTVANAGSKAADKVIYKDKDLTKIPKEERQELHKKSEKAFGAFVIIGLIIGSIVVYFISEATGIPIA